MGEPDGLRSRVSPYKKVGLRWFIPVFMSAMVLVVFFSRELNQSYVDDVVSNLESDSAASANNYPAWMDEIIEFPPKVESKRVYTFMCEIPTRKPDVFTTACADFGEIVREIEWEEWSLTNSVGSGIYSVNDCEPSCAEGKRDETPVRVWLEDVTTDGKNYFLNTLKIIPIDQIKGENYSSKNSNFNFFTDVTLNGDVYEGAVWDVSRDWKELPELRVKLP